MSKLTPKKILVVEDEPGISQVCLRTLASDGFEVDIAVNGIEAQAQLQQIDDYDLILIDIRTPVMNGKQLYHYIIEKYPKLASGTIFTTGDVMAEDTSKFLSQSSRPFLPKPFTPDELKTIARETLNQREK